MSLLGGVAAIVALWLLGALALALAGVRRHGAAALVLDYAAGAAILAFVGTLTLVLGLHLSLAPLYVLMLTLAVGVGARRSWPAVRIALPRDRVTVALLATAALLLIVLLASGLRDRLWWDGWAMWAFKARMLQLDATLPAFVMDPRSIFRYTNPDYPLAGPLVSWWLYAHTGGPNTALASFAGALWFAAVPVVAWGALRERAGSRATALATLAIAAFWPLAYFAAGGTPDVIIALALLGCVVELERALGGDEPGAFVRAGVFLSLGILAKHEGLALAVVALVACAGTWALARRRPPRVALVLALPFLVLAPWFLFLRMLGLRTQVLKQVGQMVPVDGAFGAAGATFAQELTSNLQLLGGAFARLATSPIWLPLPFLLLLGAAAAWRRREAGLLAAWAVLAGYFAAVLAAFLLIREGLDWLLATSFTRVLATLVPAAVVLALLSVSGMRSRVHVRPDPREAEADAVAV